MSKKTALIYSIGFCGAVVLIIFLSKYVAPILITRNNRFFDESENFLASVKRSKRNITNSNIRQVIAPTVFQDNFNTNYTVEETGNQANTLNSNWWIGSGGRLYSQNGYGSTIIGQLGMLDPWRVAFSISNPLDTDNGYHPQNIFRLVAIKNLWKNFQQVSYFNIVTDNLSESPNRNASNGLLFFNRYKDEFNLYYAGIRVDGYAVIKKKINGIYYTMAYKPLAKTVAPYDRTTNPNALPKQQWIGMKSEVVTNADNTVTIKLYTDVGKTGTWTLVAEAVDDGIKYGGAVFTDGYTGIRTDFMDVLFDDYSVTAI